MGTMGERLPELICNRDKLQTDMDDVKGAMADKVKALKKETRGGEKCYDDMIKEFETKIERLDAEIRRAAQTPFQLDNGLGL